MRDVGVPAAPMTFLANALRRHLPLIIVLGIVGAVGGIGLAVRQGISYTATSAILVNPLDGNPFAPDGRGEQLVNLETEAQLVGTEGVAALVARKLKSDLGVDELRSQVQVENPTNTQVLRISFTDTSRPGALRGSQAFADSYLAYRATRARSIADARLTRVRKQQTAIQAKLADVTAELADTAEGSSRRAYLEERTSALASQVASLETEVSTLTAADLEPGQVISPAALPLTAGGTNAVVFGGAGVVAGVALGALVALFRTRADDRLHDPADVENLAIRLLGVITDRNRFGARADTTRTRSRPLPEPYRILRTAIISSVDAPPAALSIASVSADVSAAPEAAGLATGLARAGFSVVIVDTTGETTQLLTGNVALPGLSGILAGTTDLRHVLVQPEDHLVLLPSGKPQRDTMDQLLSPQMRATVRSLREWYDYVLISGQPVTSADGQALAALSDAVLLVAARKFTTHAELQASAAALARVQAVPIGAVVIDGPDAARPRREGATFTYTPLTGSAEGRTVRTDAHQVAETAGGSPSVPPARATRRPDTPARSPGEAAARPKGEPATARPAGENPTRTHHETPLRANDDVTMRINAAAAARQGASRESEPRSGGSGDNGHGPHADGRGFRAEDR